MRSLLVIPLAGLMLLATPASATVVIDWVPIDNPGNGPDTLDNCFGTNCGSVPYSYFISKYEVTNAQYAEFLNAKAAADPLGLYNPNSVFYVSGGLTRSGSSGSYTYSVNAGFADKPVTFVSVYDSMRFANWMSNGQGNADTETGVYTLLGGTPTPSNGLTVSRIQGVGIFLPTENEWYKAAYYDGLSATYFDYPAGSNQETVCSAPTATANRANCLTLAGLGNVTDVGAYTGSASPYGTFDQGGNVWEWNEGVFAGGPVRASGLRGGGFDHVGLELAASRPRAGGGDEGGYEIGFRLVSLVPEPGTGLLLIMGLTGLAARRK